MAMISYKLPDGRIVQVERTTAKLASIVSFTLADGRIVDAIYQPTWGQCADCGSRYDLNVWPSHSCKQQARLNREFSKRNRSNR